MDDTVANDGRVTAQMRQYLAQMQPWVRLMSVLTFLAAAFAGIIGVFVALVGTVAGIATRDTSGSGIGVLGGVLFGWFYILLGAVYIPPGLFLYRTASAIKRMKAGDPTTALEDALKNQKSFWRFVGILSLVAIAIAILVMIAGIIAAVLVPILERQA
jgi:hypothetical protein